MIVSKSSAEVILGKSLKTLGDVDKRHKGKRSYYVLSETGKNMGGPYTKDGAIKRLRQVEYFKHNPSKNVLGLCFVCPCSG